MDTGTLQAKLGHLLPDEKGVKVSAAPDSLVLTAASAIPAPMATAIELASAYGRRRSGAAGDAGVDDERRQPRESSTCCGSRAPAGDAGSEDRRGQQDPAGQVGTSRFSLTRTIAAPDYILMSSSYRRRGCAGAWIGKAALEISTAEKNDGLVRVLAEPNIMAISGQAASFLSGGKIFIPVAQTDRCGDARITLEEKEFGVAVSSRRRCWTAAINLKVVRGVRAARGRLSTTRRRSPRCCRRSPRAGWTPPCSWATARASRCRPDQEQRDRHSSSRLGEVPVMGALFRSTEFQTDRPS